MARRSAGGVDPSTLDPEIMSKILLTFAKNHISAEAAMNLTGIAGMAELRRYMHKFNIPFPRETDAETGPMAELVLKMIQGERRAASAG